MGIYEKLTGTFSAVFQIGRRGPQIKNSSGVVEHRNAGDSAYAIARGADPAGADDLVTKRYGDANYAAGGGGAGGTAVLNFGAFPGKDQATVAVTGQAGIVSGSVPNAWIRPIATTDHSADEHLVENIRIMAGNIVPGTGFTIYGQSGPGHEGIRLYGQFNVAWSWR